MPRGQKHMKIPRSLNDKTDIYLQGKSTNYFVWNSMQSPRKRSRLFRHGNIWGMKPGPLFCRIGSPKRRLVGF